MADMADQKMTLNEFVTGASALYPSADLQFMLRHAGYADRNSICIPYTMLADCDALDKAHADIGRFISHIRDKGLVDGQDYVSADTVLLHPDAFELCLARTQPTSRYARQYMFLRRCVAIYQALREAGRVSGPHSYRVADSKKKPNSGVGYLYFIESTVTESRFRILCADAAPDELKIGAAGAASAASAASADYPMPTRVHCYVQCAEPAKYLAEAEAHFAHTLIGPTSWFGITRTSVDDYVQGLLKRAADRST